MDQSRVHQFGKKVLPGLFLGNDGRIGNLLEKTRCERRDISQTRRIFISNRRWTNKICWRRSGTSTLKRDRPIQGEGHVDFLGESDGSLSFDDSFLDDGEKMTDFWSMSGNFIHRHHVQTLLAERRIIPFSTEIH